MDHNINAVNVYAVDEEKLKFRVIIAINGLRYRQAPALVAGSVVDGDGQYEIDIPVPTAIANSEKCFCWCWCCGSYVVPRLRNTWGRSCDRWNYVKSASD